LNQKVTAELAFVSVNRRQVGKIRGRDNEGSRRTGNGRGLKTITGEKIEAPIVP